MNMTRETFKKCLKKMRMTQVEFAKYVGVNKGTVSAWGATRPVPHWVVLIISQHFKIDRLQDQVIELGGWISL